MSFLGRLVRRLENIFLGEGGKRAKVIEQEREERALKDITPERPEEEISDIEETLPEEDVDDWRRKIVKTGASRKGHRKQIFAFTFERNEIDRFEELRDELEEWGDITLNELGYDDYLQEPGIENPIYPDIAVGSE